MNYEKSIPANHILELNFKNWRRLNNSDGKTFFFKFVAIKKEEFYNKKKEKLDEFSQSLSTLLTKKEVDTEPVNLKGLGFLVTDLENVWYNFETKEKAKADCGMYNKMYVYQDFVKLFNLIEEKLKEISTKQDPVIILSSKKSLQARRIKETQTSSIHDTQFNVKRKRGDKANQKSDILEIELNGKVPINEDEDDDDDDFGINIVFKWMFKCKKLKPEESSKFIKVQIIDKLLKMCTVLNLQNKSIKRALDSAEKEIRKTESRNTYQYKSKYAKLIDTSEFTRASICPRMKRKRKMKFLDLTLNSENDELNKSMKLMFRQKKINERKKKIETINIRQSIDSTTRIESPTTPITPLTDESDTDDSGMSSLEDNLYGSNEPNTSGKKRKRTNSSLEKSRKKKKRKKEELPQYKKNQRKFDSFFGGRRRR